MGTDLQIPDKDGFVNPDYSRVDTKSSVMCLVFF